ncbi:hypothetical protein QPL79_06315 [Ignisphaera sp. 4213-co]|uniref:Uncharacterized protein n=1 Tax=Ignisphaera cupida TaxID=3050454 RepID=A0ABD4ZA55_9CREN|nr:hypothetical protein [Ignisphaera sp. 4213-co]MDK6028973.1 hypothetical protein [Ignisphaera sp. 4213-co]
MIEFTCERFFNILNRIAPGYGKFLQRYLLGKSSVYCKNICIVLKDIEIQFGEALANLLINFIKIVDWDMYKEILKCLNNG